MTIEEFGGAVASQIHLDDDIHQAFLGRYEGWDEQERRVALMLLLQYRPHIVLRDQAMLDLARSVCFPDNREGDHLESSASTNPG